MQEQPQAPPAVSYNDHLAEIERLRTEWSEKELVRMTRLAQQVASAQAEIRHKTDQLITAQAENDELHRQLDTCEAAADAEARPKIKQLQRDHLKALDDLNAAQEENRRLKEALGIGL